MCTKTLFPLKFSSKLNYVYWFTFTQNKDSAEENIEAEVHVGKFGEKLKTVSETC